MGLEERRQKTPKKMKLPLQQEARNQEGLQGSGSWYE